MSDFSGAKTAIAAYPSEFVLHAAFFLSSHANLWDAADEELLIYSDKQQKYGELWLLAVTPDARDRVLADDAAAKAAVQAEREAMELERMRKEEEEVILLLQILDVQRSLARC
jgi:hypothetical protein